MALYGSPFFQSTLSFLSITNRRHCFFPSCSFLNHCSPVVGKLVAYTMDSSMSLNSNDPTLTQPRLNFFVISSSTPMWKPSNFCKNGRNLDSCNSARLFKYFVVCSISFKDDDSFLMGAMFELHFTILGHNLKRILMSDTNSCWELYAGGSSILRLFSPTQPIMMKITPQIRCKYISAYYGWTIKIGCGGGLCGSGPTVIMTGYEVR